MPSLRDSQTLIHGSLGLASQAITCRRFATLPGLAFLVRRKLAGYVKSPAELALSSFPLLGDAKTV